MRRWILGHKVAAGAAGCLVLVLAVASVAWLLVRPPGPADVTRTYLTALEHRDYRRAFAQLTPESRASVGGAEGLASTSLGAALSSGIAEKFEIVSQSVEGDRATDILQPEPGADSWS